MNSIEKICEIIWKVEVSHSLFYRKGLNLPIWPMIRMRAYYYLAEALGVFGVPHPKKNGLGQKIAFCGRVLLELIKSGVMCWAARHATSLVFEHPRSKRVEQNVIDIYSYYYVRDKEAESPGSTLVLSRTELGRIEKVDGFNRVAIDMIEGLRSLAGRFLSFMVPSAALPNGAIDDLCTSVFENVDQRSLGRRTLRRLFRQGAIEYGVSYVLYYLLFSWFSRSKEVVLVDGYSSRAGLIAAARKKGKRVIELQHGVLGRFHLGYSYPSACSKRHLPDALYVWSSFWKNELEDIWPAETTVYGYKYLEDVKMRLYSGITRQEKTIVVVSQGAISSQLADVIWKEREALSSCKIYYKLHPSETATWRNSASLRQLDALENVEVIVDGDIYDLFSLCEYQLGVFSTALHEGAAFGCKTILVPLPGIEYMKNFSGAIAFQDFVCGARC